MTGFSVLNIRIEKTGRIPSIPVPWKSYGSARSNRVWRRLHHRIDSSSNALDIFPWMMIRKKELSFSIELLHCGTHGRKSRSPEARRGRSWGLLRSDAMTAAISELHILELFQVLGERVMASLGLWPKYTTTPRPFSLIFLASFNMFLTHRF